ncbi:MAG TPA: nuclear transport factor 2 family protein [Acidimicrobiales bacterium]
MPAFPRAELEEMVERWLQANRDAEAAGDWRPMAELYAPDATYGWNYGPEHEFMAVGREQIRDVALGLEMGGLDGWQYPYEEILIDDRKGQVIGLWRQIADATRADGSRYEVAGIGGSWFGYAGDQQWSFQRDWFDYGNAAALFLEMMRDGTLSEGMTARMHRSLGGDLPGHHPVGQAPAPIWPER